MARQAAVAFSIDGRGYVTTGSGTSLLNDMWEYNPSTNTWLGKTPLPGIGRMYATGFAIGGKGYVGTGTAGLSGLLNEFWQYDPVNDSWLQRANFPGGPRQEATGIAIGNFGYLGLGSAQGTYLFDWYQYNPATDSWTIKAPFLGGPREEASQFTIGTSGFVGTGYDGLSAGVMKKDFWEYRPDSTTSINEIAESDVSITMNASNSSLTVAFENISGLPLSLELFDASGKKITGFKNVQFPFEVSTAGFSDGVYMLTAIILKALSGQRRFW
ncbi:MAG: hypothetical protein IPL22_05740 [Bacteroidetes bacterium]|nr:hypothetical protein [Bacteroidota bacterium]